MKLKIVALTALMAAMAAPAFAQTAPAAAAGYTSPCKRPALEPYPAIPDAKAKAAQVAKATAVYKAWSAPVQPYLECMEKEFYRLDNEVNAKSKGVGDPTYNALVDALNKGVDAAKAAGLSPAVSGAPPKPGKACPPAPAVTAAPAIPPPVGDPKADKKRIEAAQKAFSDWGGPIYIYAKCMEPKMQASTTAANGEIAPLIAARAEVSKEHDEVMNQFNAFNEKWSAFARNYNGG